MMNNAQVRYYAEQNSSLIQNVNTEKSDQFKESLSIIEDYENKHPIENPKRSIIGEHVVVNEESIDNNATNSGISCTMKEITKPKYTNPFAKSKQNNILPLESQVGCNPLEAVVTLMKKKVTVASSESIN